MQAAADAQISCSTYNRAGKMAGMKTNVTVKIDTDLLREARIMAAEQGSSISAIVAAQLEKAVRERKDYEQAKRKALALMRKGFDLRYEPPASRDELHER